MHQDTSADMLKSNQFKKNKNDIILVGIILSLSLIGFLVFKLTMKDGKYISVSVNGKEKQSYSISDNIETDIVTGENSENANTLVIKAVKHILKVQPVLTRFVLDIGRFQKTAKPLYVCRIKLLFQ